MPHEGNARESEEEALAVAGIFQRLLSGGATFTSRKGETRPLALDDLLVVAPYNAQVDRIRRALHAAGFQGARVGTVDKFQGQEAPVAIYSLASSSAEDAPRGMEFLYALDRLNVEPVQDVRSPGSRGVEADDAHGSAASQVAGVGLEVLESVQGSGSQIGLATRGTADHRHVLDHEQIVAASRRPGDPEDSRAFASAVLATHESRP